MISFGVASGPGALQDLLAGALGKRGLAVSAARRGSTIMNGGASRSILTPPTGFSRTRARSSATPSPRPSARLRPATTALRAAQPDRQAARAAVRARPHAIPCAHGRGSDRPSASPSPKRRRASPAAYRGARRWRRQSRSPPRQAPIPCCARRTADSEPPGAETANGLTQLCAGAVVGASMLDSSAVCSLSACSASICISAAGWFEGHSALGATVACATSAIISSFHAALGAPSP